MSSKITILDSATAMKIAAGEVIEKPASAVRELLDNALDAEATWISIEVEQGGKEFLSVQDNGLGMSEEDLKKSYLNHATSKIQNFDDLIQLKTFGFRGEALASLAEIAQLTIASREQGQDFGAELAITFGEKGSFSPKGMNQGTKITITKFFQNVPARLKFLSTDTSEYRAIIQEMIKKALAKPQVAFELSHNGDKKYQLNASNELYDRIVDLFPELKNILQAFIYEENGIKVYGFLSNPSWYKATRTYQYLFVNGRVIEWTPFRQQITVAYNNLLPPSKFPAVFCYIEIDTEQIDFNVHPQKKEIRFDNEKIVADVVRRAIRRGVEQSNYVLDTSHQDVSIQDRAISNPQNFAKTNTISSYSNTNFTPSSTKYPSPKNNYYSREPISSSPKIDQLQELFEKKESNSYEIIMASRYVGTIFNTFLIFEYQHSLYLIDFHAMHERIRYEKILDKYNEVIPSQNIIPIIFEVAKHEAVIFEKIESTLIQLGFQISQISESSFSVEGIPSVLNVGNTETVLRELFVEDLSIQDSHMWDSLCKMIACKGSARSGDTLSFDEIQALLKEWKDCKNPQSCPHGRPIVVPMSRGFFDKEFKRTGF